MGRKDKIITINSKTSEVFFDSGVLGIDGENLQGDLIFQFDNFVDGIGRLEIEIDNTKSYTMLNKVNETYTLPIKSFLTKTGKINLQLIVDEENIGNSTPVFKSKIFYLMVNNSIGAEIEQPEELQTWIEMADQKLLEVDNALQDIIDLRFQIENGDLILTVGGENNG